MISENLINKLMLWEGVKNKPYPDSRRLLTIGCGHLLTKSELSAGKICIDGVWVRYSGGITNKQISQLLKQDLRVRDIALTRSLTTSVNQNQYDALLSFVFNVGIDAFRHSDLLELLNTGFYNSVPAQLRRWNKAGGKKDKGLVNRRNYEIELWNLPVVA